MLLYQNVKDCSYTMKTQQKTFQRKNYLETQNSKNLSPGLSNKIR